LFDPALEKRYDRWTVLTAVSLFRFVTGEIDLKLAYYVRRRMNRTKQISS